MMTIKEMKNKVYELGSQIGLDTNSELYPLFSDNSEVFNEGISVYVDDEKYHYVAMERGKEVKHFKTKNLDDILYKIFKDITFTIAKKYELENRIETEDFRRLLWNKQLELLNNLSINYYNTREKEIENILEIAPFKD